MTTLYNHPRISIDPEVCHGQPVIAGTRVIVSQILAALAAGESPERLKNDYPTISSSDITAALSFASDLAKFEELIIRDVAS